MNESQRETMYNAWASSKIFLEVEKTPTFDSVIVSTKYNGQTYLEECFIKECYGSADPYNIAFNRLLRRLQEINKNIELRYEI